MITLSETLRAAVTGGKPQRFLLEFPDGNGDYTNATRFSNEDIVVDQGVRLNAPFNPEEELTVGSCPSAEIQFALLNDRRQISSFTFGECKAWLGARIDSGTPTMKTVSFTENGRTETYEFAPLGVFIVNRPDVVQKDIINISANDRMTLFDVEMPSTSDLALTYPTTLLGLANAMCAYVGVTLATQTFLNADLAIASRPSQFDGHTMREVLRWVAEAAGSIARFNRYGELEITWFSATDAVFSEGSYSEAVPSWYETAAIDGLKVRNQSETSESSYGTADNPYVIAGNPFLR